MRISDWSSDVCSSDLPDPPASAALAASAGPGSGFFGTGSASQHVWLLPAQPALRLLLFQSRQLCAHPDQYLPAASAPCGTIRPRNPQCLGRSEEHTSELQSLMRISYAVFCLKKNKNLTPKKIYHTT